MAIDLDSYDFAAISLTWNDLVTKMPFTNRLTNTCLQPVADSDIRNIRKCKCQIFDRQNLSCEILRNHEKVDRIMHLVAKLSDFWLFHPGFFSLFYNRFYLSSHLCEADSLSTSEALICILAILNVYGSVTKRLRSSSASCECSPQCLPQNSFISFLNIYTWWPLRSKVCFTGGHVKKLLT